MTARCYWITGLAGAGKTTMARALAAELESAGNRPVVLDGDELRAVFGERFGYTREERQMLAMSYARLCRMLVSQGFTVVIATISLFHAVHAWNREHIPGYVEIFLDVPEAVLHQRDQKGLYSSASAGLQKDVAGVTQHYELPQAPHVHLQADGSQPVTELTARVIEQVSRMQGAAAQRAGHA